MERPDIDNYKDEIHHPNGSVEDRWRHNDYVEDLNKYIDHLEELKLLNIPPVIETNCGNCKNMVCESPCSDQPYPEFFCGKKHWDGITDTKQLENEIDCKDHYR